MVELTQILFSTRHLVPVMDGRVTRFEKLKSLLEGNSIKSSRVEYFCSHIDHHCVVFSETEETRKVMIPTDVVLEWISALEFGIINMDMGAREMRGKVSHSSDWAPYQHGFESHLYAILKLWALA